MLPFGSRLSYNVKPDAENDGNGDEAYPDDIDNIRVWRESSW